MHSRFLLSFFSHNALILCGFHILFPNPTQLPFPLPLPSAFVKDPPPPKTKFKSIAKNTKQKKKKQTNRISAWKLQCGPLSCIVHPLVQTSLRISVHCNGSLVWLGASGLCYPIDTGPSLELLDILLLSFVKDILQL